MSKHVTHVDVDFEQVLEDRGSAVCFEINGEMVWLPAVAIQIDHDNKLVTVPYKLAYNKGLI